MDRITKKFNDLHGETTSRKYLERFLIEAKEENNTEVVYRVARILRKNPNAKKFKINVLKYNGLNAPHHSGTYKEALDSSGRLKKGWKFEKGAIVKVEKKSKQGLGNPQSDLTIEELQGLGIPYIENPNFDDEKEGLGRAVSSNDIYDMITKSVMKAVKNSKAKYKKAWTTKNAVDKFLIPINFISKKEYRGVNHTLLKSQLDGGFFDAWNNPYFLTFKQIEELKGKVKKGAEACKVVYFTKLYKINSKDHKDFGTYDVKKAEKYCKEKGIDKDLIFVIPILKYYNVFNGSDIEGIDFNLKEVKVGRIVPDTETNVFAKLIVKNYPKPAPKIKHGGNEAFYNGADYIQMPLFTSFKTEADYYRTLFHELTHSTGNARRLNRDMSGKFGSDKYAKEELVAEFGAVFLSAYAGIIWFNNDNHVAYLKSWNRRFERAKKDNKFLMRGASEAQKATDYVLGVKNGSEPSFYKDLKDVETKKENPKKQNSTKKEFKPKTGKVVKDNFIKWVKYYINVDLVPALDDSLKAKRSCFNITPSKLKTVDLQNLERLKYDKSSPFKVDLQDNGVDRLAVVVTQIKSVNIPKNNPKVDKNGQIALFGALPQFDNLKEAQKYYLDWAFENLIGKKVFHKEINKWVVFNATGVKHSINSFLDEGRISLITQAEKMLKNSKLIKFEEDYRKRKSIKGAYKMRSVAVLNGKKINVILTLRQGLNGVVYYDHKIEKSIKTPSTPTRTKKNRLADQRKNAFHKDKSTTKKQKRKRKSKKGLNAPVNVGKVFSKYTKTISDAIDKAENKNKKGLGVSLMERLKMQNNTKPSFYDIKNKDISKFLGNVERKNKESVVITVTGGQGSGKTRFAFQLMEVFGQNYKVGHASIEEHPQSTLYMNKVHEYLSEKAISNIDVPEVESLSDLDKLIKNNDVIVIDSFQKMKEIDKSFEVDKDLRKKYDGKLFIVIFQQTSNGSMRGGTKSQFDADIVLFTEKFDDFTKSYIYADKNRYQSTPLNELKYNMYHQKLM